MKAIFLVPGLFRSTLVRYYFEDHLSGVTNRRCHLAHAKIVKIRLKGCYGGLNGL